MPMTKLLTQGSCLVEYPPHPSKSESPRFSIYIESREKWNSETEICIQLQDAKGARMMNLPLNGDDLDASELTWAITKALRQWNNMKT